MQQTDEKSRLDREFSAIRSKWNFDVKYWSAIGVVLFDEKKKEREKNGIEKNTAKVETNLAATYADFRNVPRVIE